MSITSIDKDTIQIQKKGKDRKFKEFIIPSFDGKKVVIANNGFQKCNFGTITFECNVIRVGKDAFAGSTIKKIKNYKKVNYLNVEDDVLRLNLLKHALKDYKQDDKKNYLTDEILAKDLVALLERVDDKSIFNSDDEIGYAIDRIHSKNLTNYIDFGRSSKKMDVLKTICTYNAVFMKQIENNEILSFVKENYESLLKVGFEGTTVLLIRKDIYQSWAGFPNSDQSICELISKIVTTSSSIKNAFSDYFYVVNYSDYGADSFIEDCKSVLDRCIKNKTQIDVGYSWSLGRELTLDDVVKELPSLIVNK
ncbi:MAG: hypothetical protein IJR08_00300 [Bacilli bacterium]|nr:hypothetical protein [Bacilli bacterium]